MLLATGLLALLVIVHGDGIKGGARGIKGASSVTQEKIIQEDLPTPYNFNIKTGASYGTKITREETGDSDGRVKGSYTVSNPRGVGRVVEYKADDTGFHASIKSSEPNVKTHSPSNVKFESVSKKAPSGAVKTVSERIGKTHATPSLHHAASTPVVQDQVKIDEPSTIKTVQKVPEGKKILVKAPATHHAIQRVKTSKPVLDPSSSIKTVKSDIKFLKDDIQLRDSSAGIKSVKSVPPRNVKFSSKDSQEKVFTVNPVTEKIKSIEDPITRNTRIFASSATVAKQSSRADVDSRKSQGALSRRKPISPARVRLNSGQGAGQRTSTGVATKYTTVQRTNTAISSQRPQTSGQRSIASGRVRQSIPTPDSNTIRFNGQEININNLRAGQLFDENLKPILSDKQSAPKIVTFSAAKPATQSRSSSRAQQTLPTPSRNAARQSSRTAVASRTSQGSLSGQKPIATQRIHLSSGQGAGQRTSTGVATKYSTAQRTTSAVSSQRPQTSGQSSITSGQGRQSISSTGSNTIRFNGQEINIKNLRAGQLFDENLQPILSDKQAAPNRDMSQAAKPATQSRPSSRAQQTLPTSSRNAARQSSRAAVASRTSQGTLLGRKPTSAQRVRLSSGQGTGQRTSTGVVTKYSTAQRTTSAVSSQRPQTSAQSSTASGQGRQSISSTGSNTIRFNGQEINIKNLRAGQLFDENLQPILSDKQAAPNRDTSQAAKPATQSRPAIRAQQTLSTSSRSAARQSSRAAVAGRTSQGTLLGRKPASAQRVRLSSGQGTGQRTSTGVVTKYSTAKRTTSAVSSQRPQTSGQSSIASGQGRQSISLTGSNTIRFNGQEINIKNLRAGQLFDENLQPILSDKQAAPNRDTSQAAKPATQSRPAIRAQQTLSTSSRSAARQSSRAAVGSRTSQGTLLGRKPASAQRVRLSSGQGTGQRTSTGVVTKYSTAQRTTSAVSSQRPQTSGQSSIASGQGRQSVSSTGSNTIRFNGQEINIKNLRASQHFDENLRPILSDKQAAPKRDTSQAAKPATQSRPAIRAQQTLSTSSRSAARQSSRAAVGSRTSQGTLLGRKPASAERVRLGSGQGTGQRTSTGVVTKYSTAQRTTSAVSSQRPQTSGQSSIASGQGRQSISSTGSNTIRFNGQEINIKNLRAGQHFDENLRPILSDKQAAPKRDTSQAAKPATQSRPAIRAQQTLSTSSRSAARQSSRTAVAGRTSQGTLLGRKPASAQRVRLGSGQGTGQRTSTGVVTKYSTAQRTTSAVSSQRPQTSGQSSIASGQGRQSISSTGSNTIRFNGQEINIKNLRAGQLFDENLQPILSDKQAAPNRDTSQAAKPAMQSRSAIQAQQTLSTSSRSAARQSSRAAVGSRTSQGTLLGRKPASAQRVHLSSGQGTGQRTSTGVVTKYSTAQRTTSAVSSQRPQTSGQSSIASGQGRQSISSTGSNTIRFNGQEINIKNLRAGQLFDENLQPILSDKQAAPNRDTSQAAKPAMQSRSAIQAQQTLSTSSRSAARQSSRAAVGSRTSQGTLLGRKPASAQRVHLSSGQGTGQRTSTGVVTKYSTAQRTTSAVSSQRPQTSGQSSIASGQGRQSISSTGSNTIRFNGQEINIKNLRAGQLFDENLQPILSDKQAAPKRDTSQAAKPATQSRPAIRAQQTLSTSSRSAARQSSRAAVAGRTSQGTLLGRKPASAQRVRLGSGQDAGRRTSTGVVTKYSTAQRTTSAVSSQRPQTSAESSTASGQGRQSISSTGSNTIRFNGQEINIKNLRAGQLFDENLQPILSDKQVAPNRDMSQAVKPATQSRPSSRAQQTLPTSSRNAARQSSRTIVASRTSQGTLSGRKPASVQSVRLGSGQGAGARTSSGVVTKYSTAQRTTSAISSQRPQTSGQSSIASGQGRQSISSTGSNTIRFNGQEININNMRTGQLFDGNLQPILSEKQAVSNKDTSTFSHAAKPETQLRPAIGGQQTLSTSSRSAGRQSSRTSNPETRTRYAQTYSNTPRTGGMQSTWISPSSRTRQSTNIAEKSRTLAGVHSYQATRDISGIREVARENKPVSIPSPMVPASGIGIFSNRQAGISQFVDNNVGNRRLRPSSESRTSQALSSTSTIHFHGKEINIDGLKAGQIFDENLHPILSADSNSAIRDKSRVLSNSRSDLRTSTQELQRSGLGISTTTRSSQPGLRSNIRMRGQSVGGGVRTYSQNSMQGSTTLSATTSGSATISGYQKPGVRSGFSPASQNSQTGEIRVPGLKTTQEKLVQDELETEITQKKQDPPFLTKITPDVQQTMIQEQEPENDFTKASTQLSQKTLGPTESKQTQIKLEDVLDQSPTSKSTSMKVSQKDVGDSIIQQKTTVGDFSGYLPKASFLSPFNYKVPQIQALKYAVKSPIVQEQQKIEQVFV